MFGQGQFDDASEGSEDRMHDEMDLQRRALAYQQHAQQTRPRASELSARQEAAMFMTSIGGAEGVETAYGHGLSPYYQRQTHSSPYAPRPYLTQQGAYAGMHSPGDVYGRRNAQFSYAAASPDQRHSYHPQYGAHQASPTHRDFSSYYARQAQDLSQATIMERAYGARGRNEEEESAAAAMLSGATVEEASPSAASTSNASYLSTAQTKKSPPTKASSSTKAGRGGRAGRGSRGRGSGRGGRGGRSSKSAAKKSATDRPSSPTDAPDERWFAGTVPLGLPEDKFWLSELQVYLRSNFAEAFGATEQDIAAPMHGRNKPIALGQVGIRCIHCKNDPPSERGQQATSYPSLISGIYNSVQQMLRLHFDCCLAMPREVRQKIESLKVSSSARGGRKQYWIDSAKRLGLADTPHGIHFGRDPYGPLPPIDGPLACKEEQKKPPDDADAGDDAADEAATGDATENQEGAAPPEDETPPAPMYPLVIPEDKPLISDYLYVTLEQMQPCNLMEADKVGCYKGRKVGFPGLACKHCVGQAGCGRYFPASEASLSQTTTSQTIMNHVRNCRRCPIEIRENLELMKRARMGPDGKRADKPKHGGRKVFFHRLWCRIQRVPMEEEEETGRKKGSGTWSRQKKGMSPRKSAHRKRHLPSPDETSSSDMDEYGDHPRSSSEEETETEEESTTDDSDEESSGAGASLAQKFQGKAGFEKKKKASYWHEGCVRLTKTDDSHWLSEMHCYARSDLVEVFSLGKKDSLDGYGGRKEPSVGQVAVRCVFCKTLEESERPSSFIYFPDSLSTIHVKVNDLIRLHFPSCPAMSDDVKDTFKSLRGFGAKAVGDSQQYWIDSARDIGLADIPPTSDGWGITFRRNPLEPSPADELDRESVEGRSSPSSSKFSFVRPEDRGSCTDHVTLLLRQVKPCRFKKSDRRCGPGGRGRDRVIGYPGVCCRWCITKNNFGRYFPVSSKNLTDNTANSLQAHVASCTRCPEPIKASLAYLTHRSMLQKAELSGSWKKTFFKRVWDRLHVERAWTAVDDGDAGGDDSASSSSGENNNDLDSKNGNGGTDTDDEELGEDMSDLIKAAAVWLLEQEESSETLSRTRTRGRGLPGKRLLAFSPGKGRGRGGLTSKRRRVHFP